MAEVLLRAALPPGAGLVASSAGTHPLTGHEMDGAAAHAVRELGGDPATHQARGLTPALATGSDLVLTATATQRAEVEALAPRVRDRTFTLREFVRVGTGLPLTGSPRERIQAVHSTRATARPAPSGGDDIGDPFGAPWWQVVACAGVIEAAVRDTLRVLGVEPA